MGKRLRAKLTYSNVIASIALFVALSGVAVAANNLPRHSVGPKQLKRGAVTAAKIRRASVKANKLAPRAVTAGRIAHGAVLPGSIANGAVDTEKIASNTIRAKNIHNGVITTNKLNKNAVTHQKLAPEAVGAGNMQNGSVGSANIRDNSVGTNTLRDGSVTAAKLGSDVGPLTGTLKSGQTLRGVFSIGSTGQAAGDTTRGAVSYQFPLLAAPTLITILAKGATTPECGGLSGGSEQTPLAAPGNLCIYTETRQNLNELEKPLEVDYSVRLGFGLVAEAKEAGPYYADGQWAVTAP